MAEHPHEDDPRDLGPLHSDSTDDQHRHNAVPTAGWDTSSATTRSRIASVVRAGHDGDPVLVRSGLDDPDAAVRAVAIAAMLRLAETGVGAATEATDSVLAGLHDEAPTVRRRAATVAARLAHLVDDLGQSLVTADELGAVARRLVELLDDGDARIVEVAAFACGEIPLDEHDEVRGRVLDALAATTSGHDDALCRESAVAALGAIGEPTALPIVIAACSDRANVRRRAVLALAAFDDPAATAELRRLREDRDIQVRQAAEELLAIESGEPT